MSNQAIRMIDLFAGCGGMTAGFVREGFVPALAVEWNLYAAATYAANFGADHVIAGDIADVTKDRIPTADLIIGGPPCQGFSNLGSKDINDPRNQLWKEYVRFITHAQPKVFVIENVDRFMKSSEFALLNQEADGGMLKDYKLSFNILNAADYGVAQRRKRAIVIGSRVGKIPLPRPTHAKDPGLDPDLTPWLTTADRIKDLPKNPDTTELPDSSIEFFDKKMQGIFKGLDLHVGRQPTERSLERYNHIPPGGGRFNLPDHLLSPCWRKKKTGTTDVMGRMQWDSPSLTIRTEFFKPEKGQYLHPQWDETDPSNRVNRPITHLEAALLQDFSPGYQWCGSKVEIARQIGNAVPVGLAQALAKHIKKYL
ncbi:DNA (cytosine-5)-methyltransferase 1 [Streptosporangium album]|uniref:Cytosine-specific methyltransferase n=1 Tax=Streptosporangium album TaxID=47479 RepID=A0A7W7W8I5_9ACTN|nr:DNA cytosine methyltransferase [Streptosporangium album]MBB4937846.1 DNA (cytosine-5)-methyltransferase 1 [Streptosporangium album]